jgi:hypothetical protein
MMKRKEWSGNMHGKCKSIHHEDVWKSGGIAPGIPSVLFGEKWFASRHGRFTSGGKTGGTNLI